MNMSIIGVKTIKSKTLYYTIWLRFCLSFKTKPRGVLVAKLKPLLAKQNRASLAHGAVIISLFLEPLPTCFTPAQSLDQLLLRVVLTIESVKKWVLAVLTSFLLYEPRHEISNDLTF